MTNDVNQKRRWADHVLLGTGTGESRLRSEDLNYRDRVLFSGMWPVSRLVQVYDGHNFVCLHRTGQVVPITDPGKKGDRPTVVANIRVPCIGVFTWVPGDLVKEGELLNERLRWLWITQAHDIVALAMDMTGHKMFTARGWTKGKQVESQIEMANIVKMYEAYRTNVAPNDWPMFPREIPERLDEAVETKSKFYFSDKEVEKRDRKQATREAVKALNI